jgi:hypothetical protein
VNPKCEECDWSVGRGRDLCMRDEACGIVSCVIMRKDNQPCGPTGKLFEPKAKEER